MATKAPSIGFLPYGSSDESVIFADPLTDIVTTSTLPSASVITRGTPAHDSVLGLKDGGYEVLNITNGDNANNQWQITFEIQKEWLCKNEQGSTGYAPASTETLLVVEPDSGDDLFLLRKGTAADFTNGLLDTGAVKIDDAYWDTSVGTSFQEISSIGKGEFVTINMFGIGGHAGGVIGMAVDGLPLVQATTAHAGFADFGDSFHINNSFAGGFGTYYMRNLQLSSKAPVFPVHPKLRRLMIWGDSQVSTQGVAPTTAYTFDNAQILSCMRKLAQKGIYVGTALTNRNAGDSISTTNPGSAEDSRAAMLATNPTIILCRWGTNDAITYNADFEADLQTEITNCMAHESVEYMIFSNVPSLVGDTDENTSSNKADLATINAIYDSIPAWWDTNNPTNTGKVKVFDNYTKQGGLSPPAETYIGQSLGSYADAHYAGKGALVEGEGFADEILKILGDL